MDVNFSTVLEGTRKYFQGLPKGFDKDGNPLPEEMGPSTGNGGPSPETGSPPSAAHPQDPLEPEAHIIHKATVMQQAQRQQAQAQAQAQGLLERPPSANLISPPPHIIRKPQPSASEECRPRYSTHIPTPPAPSRYSPHIPTQPPPTPLYQNRAQPQRALTVLQARRPSPVQAVSRSYQEETHQRVTDVSFRQIPPPNTHKELQELHPPRQHEPTPAPVISQDQRHITSVPNHHLEHRKSSPLTAQHLPIIRSSHVNQSYPGYPGYPSQQSSIDSNNRTGNEHETHPGTTRTYPTIQPQTRTKPSHHYQDIGPQPYNNSKMVQPSQPPASYQRTKELYNSQTNHKAPSTMSHLTSRSSKPASSSELSYSASRMSHHKQQSSNLSPSIPGVPNYQERLPALSVDQRQMYSNLPPNVHSNSRSSQSIHPGSLGHNIHPNMGRSSSNPVELQDHQNRVPPIHPHHQPSRVPVDYPQHQTSRAQMASSHHYTNEQYRAPHPSSSSGPSVSSNHQVQSYNATAVKSSYNTSPKHNYHQQRNIASKPSALPHQQKMTVSVTSIVNQMNTKRQQVLPDPSTSAPSKHKKESPLDLSVKTVRIPADSTAKDEVESAYDKRDGIIRHSSMHNTTLHESYPTAVSSKRHLTYTDKPNNVGAGSHKVDFLPNFNTNSNTEKALQYREQNNAYLAASRQSSSHYDRTQYNKHADPRSVLPKVGSHTDSRNYPNQYEPPHPSKHPYSSPTYNRRIDPSLPKIDLTISLDENDKDRSDHATVYNKEIARRREEESRKRDASHIPNHIPPKVARYESWNIDRHRLYEQQHKESTAATNNHYIPNGSSVHNQSQRKPYDPNNPYRKSENVEPHSSKYYQHGSVHQSHPQNDLYYQPGSQKHNNHHAYEYPAHDKQYAVNHDAPIPLHPPQYNYQNSAPADKRVLSILRNSLGAKNPEIQKTVESDDCIIIQDDTSPPSIDLTEYQTKKARLASENRMPSTSQFHDSNNLPHKMHVPRAVDSIKYDSDSSPRSMKGREEIPSPVPIKTETATYTLPMSEHVQVEIDIAARIRTKGELKGFIQPVASNEPEVIPIVSVETKKDNISVLSVIKTDNVPQQTHRRRLFSRDNTEEPKKEIRKSFESSIFDFPGSDSESEAPSLDKSRLINSGKENISENLNKTSVEDVTMLANIKSEIDVDDDPFWSSTCDSFLEELKSGKVKKCKRKKFLHSGTDEDCYDTNNESIQIDKSVIVSVADIKKEPETFPLVTKIKEEIIETIEEGMYDTDSSDENIPLIQQIKKEKDISLPSLIDRNEKMGLRCPIIKLEKNLILMNSARTTVKLSGENTYTLVSKDIDDDKDGKVSSDDERLIVKKRKQEMLKNSSKETSKDKMDSSDSDSEVISRLRVRKNLTHKSSDDAKALKSPLEDELKLREESHIKKPGFGDGSDFRPGWENEVYNYKRSLRMPARLINVSRPPYWPRVSSSLPDLDPCPNSPAPSTSTEELFTQKKYSCVIYDSNEKIKRELDSDLESLSSYAVPKTNYDSEASSSTVISTTSKRTNKTDGGSIVDVLMQKCGHKDLKKKKNKDEGPKLIPKSENLVELLATPGLGLEKTVTKKGIKNISREKVMEELFYLGSFRKQTVSTFRDAFISNTDGVLGATEEFSPVVLKTRTRTETRVLKKRATIQEVFGDERPASAPPVACTENERVKPVKEHKIKLEITKTKEDIKKSDTKPIKNDMKTKEDIKSKDDIKLKEYVKKKDEIKSKDSSKPSKDDKVTVKKVKKNIFNSTVRDGLRSSQLSRRNDSTGRMLRRKKRNNLIKVLASKKIKKSELSSSPKIKKEPLDNTETEKVIQIKIKKEPEDGEEPTKKRFKRLFNRRKLSSGFDYIRKKKKLIKKEDGVLRKRFAVSRPSPESVNDIQKEIKNWIIKKSVGETVLHRAARLGYIDCVAYCLEKMDVPPSCRDNAGYTPLHEACSRGHLDIARLLLQYGADVSEAAQGGIRPLHEACENGYIEIIRLLLSYGADPLLATYSGQSPISLSTGTCVRFLQLHLNDVQGNVPQPWHFNGPCKLLDPVDSGYDPLASPPPSPTPPPSSPQEFVCSLVPHPPLYRLRPTTPAQSPDPTLWCLLQDLASILQVKSRDALLKQVHCGPGVPRDSLKELKMQEFLDRAQCQQLLAAGEKINIRASKIALVRYTEKVKQLLNAESVTVR